MREISRRLRRTCPFSLTRSLQPKFLATWRPSRSLGFWLDLGISRHQSFHGLSGNSKCGIQLTQLNTFVFSKNGDLYIFIIIYICICMYYIHIKIHICIQLCTYLGIYTNTYIYIHIFEHVLICLYRCIYIYICKYIFK